MSKYLPTDTKSRDGPDHLGWYLPRGPVRLRDETLARALEHLCEQQDEQSGTQCQFKGNPEKRLPLRKETSIHLYRIGQEAVMNAHRHAEASRVEVGLEREGDVLRLQVRDDGIGMPDEFRETSGQDAEGIGLRTMRHRANLIGGSLRIDSDGEWSTVVTCRLPLREAERS